jgi:2-polyprenyl-6-methoxyphenol hydroxylase-like FAD-dependent oxidoreductase
MMARSLQSHRGTPHAEPTIVAALKAYDAERRPRIVKLLDAAEENRGVKKVRSDLPCMISG